jgi:hypothetical protein
MGETPVRAAASGASRSLGSGFAVGLLLVGCGKPAPPPPEYQILVRRPQTITWDPEQREVHPFLLSHPRVRVLMDGRVIGQARSSGEVLRITGLERAPTQPLDISASFSFAAEALLPCGWRRVPLQLKREPAAASPPPSEDSSRTIRYSGEVGTARGQPVDLWYDFRNGEAAELAVGQWTASVQAGAKGRLQVAAPDCREGAAVTLNGRKIGELPVELATAPRAFSSASLGEDPGPGGSWVFLVDPSGRRCYELAEKIYGKPGAKWYGGPNSRTYRRKLLHRLAPAEIDYFLERAPDRIDVFGPAFDTALRFELYDTPC